MWKPKIATSNAVASPSMRGVVRFDVPERQAAQQYDHRQCRNQR